MTLPGGFLNHYYCTILIIADPFNYLFIVSVAFSSAVNRHVWCMPSRLLTMVVCSLFCVVIHQEKNGAIQLKLSLVKVFDLSSVGHYEG